MKRKILYISMCLPFDKAFHAGGKTFNYYINAFADDPENEVTLIAKVLPDEEPFIQSVNPKIKLHLVSTPKSRIKKTFCYLKSLNSKYNPVYKYGNTLTKEIYDQIEKQLKALRKDGYIPEIVILEWTSMLLFIDRIKRYFPDAKYVASEHDVTFLGKERKFQAAKGFIDRKIKKASYENMKRRELAAISKCDLIVTHNQKDRVLLEKNGVPHSSLGVITPYYDRFPSSKRTPNNRDIIYYGAMNRVENSSSALWFVDNVMPNLNDCKIRFIVIGNKPPKELLDRQNEKVVVTGFVDDPATLFENSMCLVAPLLLGAGVKVKIIEALSAGIPVLTNDIGIEGIDARDGIEYFRCVTAKDYETIIRKMINGEIDLSQITKNAIEMIERSYDLKKSFSEYSNRVYSLIEEE